MPKQITNGGLYDAINTTRLELKGDITRLEGKFDNLEAGRLTRAEGNINNLGLDLQKTINDLNSKIDGIKATGSVLNAKAAIVWTIIVIVFTAFCSALFYKLVVGSIK